jgi:flavin reductase (DIM6/NTAB) family NADH-FMN oxidoreductase RutF
MYYEPGKTPHNLPFDPFKSCVVPRPIGWISTSGANGIDNLAPFSQFQNATFDPPIILFCANEGAPGKAKDTVTNVERTRNFVWNMATYDLREQVNLSSGDYPADVDEFAVAGLTKLPSRLISAPRVAESPVHFECEYLHTVHLPGNDPVGSVDIVFGRVVAVHIADSALTNGRLDITRLRPIARLGYLDYCVVDNVFTMAPPGSATLAAGMEGSAEKVRAARGK